MNHNRARKTRRGRTDTIKNRQRRRFRPLLVELEYRRLLSTFTVNNSLDDGSVGSLRWAVGQANSTSGASTIQFDSGAFATRQTVTLTGGQLELTGTTGTETITGPAAGVTVSGGGKTRVFQVDGGVTASLTGLTITGGNTAGNGGGLYNVNGTTTLTNCTVSGNSANSGGGGVASNYGAMILASCTVSGNSAEGGGGVFNHQGALRLTATTVSGNTALLQGGGVYTGQLGATSLTNSTVSGNVAYGSGGGLFSLSTRKTTLTSCTVASNTAKASGGGIEAEAAVTVISSTFTANLAQTGGAIDNFEGRFAVTVGDSILAGDSASSGNGPEFENSVTSQGNNLVSSTASSSGWITSDLTGIAGHPLDALLGPLGNNGGPTQTVSLLHGSPAIDAGNKRPHSRRRRLRRARQGISTDHRPNRRYRRL